MRSGSRCPAFYGEIPPMRWGILNDDGGYFYCITYTFGCKASGVKVIRIHDLRHSHVSLLINMGYSAVAIGNRVGHESVEITYRYAHLFPSVQKEMADKLNVERGN